MRILLVDDDWQGTEVRKQLLETCGHQVRTALTGTEALALCTECEFDLAIVDYKLPDVDGLELIRIMRNKCGTLPVILLSGQISLPDIEDGLVRDVLTKGDGALRLLRAVEGIGSPN